jgi:WD40 repeat protein/tetratricopeptide (TPR) repeat protein
VRSGKLCATLPRMGSQAGAGVFGGYRIVRTLGRGGHGTTFEAMREATGERVALKRLAVAEVSAWKSFELFQREAQVLSRLQHSAAPRYIEHFTVEGASGDTLYIAQEFVEGRSLAEVVHANGPMAEHEVRRVADELLQVLDYLGRQIPPVIHRDIKPENVILRPNGAIALVDFGAARATAAPPQGGSTTVGTYGYMAPEQLHGVATPATDIYGLACTLLFLLTGRSPVNLPRRKLRIDFRAHASVSASFAQWLDRALEPAPEDRFPSASSALFSLRKRSGGSVVPAASGIRMRPLTWALLATLALSLIGARTLLLRFDLRPFKPTSVASLAGASGASAAGDLPPRWKTDRYLPPLGLVRYFNAHMSAVFSVAVSPSGDRIVSSSNDGTLKIWDLATGSAVRSLPGHTGRVGGVAFGHNGTLVASAGPTSVLVQDPATGATRLTLEGGASSAATSVDFSPDGAWLAAGYLDGSARVWDADTGALLHTFTPGGHVFSARFSPDGQWLATAGDNQVQLWAMATTGGHVVLRGHKATVDSVAWAPDGRILATAGDDRALRLWVATQAAETRRNEDATNELWTVAFDPRGKYVATAGKEGVVRVYDAMSLKLFRSRQMEKTGVLSLAWGRDGNTLVEGDGLGRVVVLEVERPSEVDKVPPIPKDEPEVERASSPSKEIFDRAMTLVGNAGARREPVEEAEQLLLDASKRDPNDARMLVGLARVALHKGYLRSEEYTKESLSSADGLLTRALALAPQLAEAHCQRARVDYFEHDDVHAKDEALLADGLEPNGSAQVLLARLAYRANDLDEAERLALRASQKRSQISGAYEVLELIYRSRGDELAEARIYERTLDLDPKGPWTRGNYANYLLRHEEYDRAIDAARAAIQLLDYSIAHRTLAEAYSEKGAKALWESQDPGVAKTAFDNAIVADPTFAHGHYGLGAYFRQLALKRHDASLLARSNDEFDRAARLDKDARLATAARADNDRLATNLR